MVMLASARIFHDDGRSYKLGHAQCRASHISHEGLVGVPEATELQQGLDDRLLQRLLRLLDRVAVPAALLFVQARSDLCQWSRCKTSQGSTSVQGCTGGVVHVSFGNTAAEAAPA